MQERTCFGIEGCLTLSSSRWKLCKVEKDNGEGDEKVYSFSDESIRIFIRQNFTGGKGGFFNQMYEPHFTHITFNVLKNRIKIINRRLF